MPIVAYHGKLLFIIHPSINPWAQRPLVSNVQSLPHYIGEFLGYWAVSGILGNRPCWCSLPFPSSSLSQCFSIHSSPAIGFHSCFFFTADVSAPIRSTLHLLF